MEGTKLVHLFVVATTIVCPVTSLLTRGYGVRSGMKTNDLNYYIFPYFTCL